MAQGSQKLQNPPKTLDQAMNVVENKIIEMTKLIDNLEAKLDKEGDKVSNTQQGARNQILLKYYKYVTYLRNILNAKQTKDKKIINLTKDVFENTNNIIGKFDVLKTKIEKKKKEYQQQEQTIDKLEENKEIKEEQLRQKELKAKKDYALININIENTTHKFNADGKLEKVEKILSECTHNIQEGIQGFSKSLNTALQGGANNNNIVNGHKFNKNSNISDGLKSIINSNEKLSSDGINKEIIESHKSKLREIKINYEQGLDENINDFKTICEALRELNNVLKKQFKIKLNFGVLNLDDSEIKKLQEDITLLDQQITDVKDKGFIMYGLDTEKLNIGDIFKNNKEAINALNTKIKDFKTDINIKKSELTGLGNVKLTNTSESSNNSPSGPGSPPSGHGGPQSRPGSPLSRPGSPPSGPEFPPAAVSYQVNINDETVTFLENLEKIDNNLIKDGITIEDSVQQQIDKKLDELKVLKTENIDQDAIRTLENEINDLFKKANYTITDEMTEKLDEIPAVNLTETQRVFVLNYIRLLTEDRDFEKGLTFLKRDRTASNLLDEILKSNDYEKRQKLLLQLYEMRPNRKTGGKYKMKKSKKSKSKASKTTSKKAKEKENKNKNKVKSYSKSKSKKQSGGFIRGGVLFPQDFYDTSTVM